MNSIYNFIKSKIICIVFIHTLLYKYLLCEINDNFYSGILEEQTSLLQNIRDYLNLSLILTITTKNIYTGIPPILKSNIQANINKFSSVVTCNKNYILISCLDDSLLTKININTGVSNSLLNYDDVEDSLEKPNYSCSTSLTENIVYISLSLNSSSSVIHKIIKINIKNKDNNDFGPEIDNINDIQIFNLGQYKIINYDRQILCETIYEETNENIKLFCVYENYENNKYHIYGAILPDNFVDNLEYNVSIDSSKTQTSFRLYKLNKYNLRILTSNFIYDIYIKRENNENKILFNKQKFGQNINIKDLYDYNNNYLIKSSSKSLFIAISSNYYSTIEIYQNNSTDYYQIIDTTNDEGELSSFLIYYDEKNDKILVVYEFSNTIKYFKMSNNREIYNIKQYPKTLKIKSNDKVDFNVSKLIKGNNDLGTLNVYYQTEILSNSINKKNYYTEANYNFRETTQILTVTGSQNTWLEYSFCFREESDLLREFILSNATLKIQTCLFQCSNCSTDYSICDGCREGYIKLKDSTDNNCYFINQLIEGYIYDSSTKMFEPCFQTCKFCSIKGDSSSQTQQNCEKCDEGYYESYEYQGNCYKINDGEKELDKIVKNKEDNNFTSEACPNVKPYKISYTGECVETCPNTSIFYNYEYNTVNEQYIKKSKKIFGYKQGNICYESCPINTSADENNECKCSKAWHIDDNSGYISCYDQNYCLYQDYKYYVDDKNQCVKNGCPDGYYQFFFQCYRNSCPQNTIESPSNSHKCESIYEYCHINKYFQSICSNTKNDEYIYNYNKTKQYLKSCNESLIYTTKGIKTYLYNDICYSECPDELLIQDNEKGICKCKYYGYYSEDDILICYENADACSDKIIVLDNNECVNTLNDCINKNYQIFNNFCYKNGCPNNSKLDIDSANFCKCSYFFYNNIENNNLICLSEDESCYSKNYLYLNPDSLECFIDLEECFIKEYLFYFNNNCYKGECPDGKILISSIVNQTLKNDISLILNINEELENNLCVCDNILSTNYLKNNEYNGTQICISNPYEELEKICIQEKYPDEYYVNHENCAFIYQNKCLSYSPENTCVTQNNPYLLCSVEIKLNMKIFNFICFENFLDIEKNIKNISDSNVPIQTSPSIFIYAYYNNPNIDETMKSYTNLSFLYLNQCEDQLKQKYNLLPSEKIYILGIDSPNKLKKSPTTVYNFEIFLENGTQIEDLSICEGTNLTLSSPIVNEELIHYNEAVYFSSFGYDIYNKNDKFYTDYCSPASIYNNDITLYDRYKDFYPANVSFCNDTCKYSYVNLTSKRIICLCEPYKYKSYKIIDDDEEDEMNYSNYLLSLINYKVIICYRLLFDINNYYYNIGFFIGVGVLFFSIIEFGIFMKFGRDLFHKQLDDNYPKKDENQRINTIKYSVNNNHSSTIKIINDRTNRNNLISHPPRNINIFNINNKNKNNENLEKKETVNIYKKNSIKRSKGSFSKKKSINKVVNINNKSKSNNRLSILDSLEKSKSNLNINKECKNENKIIDEEILNGIDPLINYNNYIVINDDKVDKKEINNVPYTQALRIDKRSFFDIYISVLYNEIKAINIFYYKNEYVHLSLTTSIYVFSELLDFCFNCFIYSEDEVSEKYHNHGSLKVFTSLSLSFLSNIFSNILIWVFSKLTNYSEIFEILIKDVRVPEAYKWNTERIIKYTRIKLFFHYLIQFLFIIFIIYYLFVFCAVFHNSQISIGLNYFYGVIESFIISLTLTLIISISRYLSLKYKSSRLYNISKYCYQHF